MEIQELMVYPGISNWGGGGVSSINGVEQKHSENGLVQVGFDEEEKGEIADVVLEGFEEYWEDISDRLMISRMVSDSVIKGMVTAVEQEAAEKIAAKELELANLKEYLQSREIGNEVGDVKLRAVGKAYEVGNNGHGRLSCIADACTKHEKMRGNLFALRKLTREQLKNAKEEVKCVRGATSLKNICSGSELVGSGGILHEKQCQSWLYVDKMLEGLNTTVDTVCSEMDDLLLSSQILIGESREDLDLLTKLENMVMQSVIRSLQEENLLEPLNGIQTVNWLEKFNDISGIGSQLDAIHKSLRTHETGLISHGSHDFDHLHHKAFGNHLTPSTSFYGENGSVDESNVHVAESYDVQQLKHLSREELVHYFSNIIIKLKRDNESVIQQQTEEYFRLKREYLNLNERGSTVTHRKDEEFDVLRNKIPVIISKLEGFLTENERFPALTKTLESVKQLKLRLDSLLFESRQLGDSLSDKENEVKCLQEQVSDAAEALLQCSLAEENLLKSMENLKSALDDSCLETSLTEEVYKSALREQIAQTGYNPEDSNMEFLMNQEICDIIIREATFPSETPNRYEIEDSDMESWIMQGMTGLIFIESIKEAGSMINHLYREVLNGNEIITFLETTTLQKENKLRLEVEENMKLNQDIQDLRTALQEQEKLAMNLSFSLSSKSEQLALASRELTSLREHASRQNTLVAESNKDLELLKSQYLEALELIEFNKMEMRKLKQNIDQTKKVLTEVNEERNKALALAQEMHGKLLLSEAREEKLKKEMELALSELSNLFDDFECRISGGIRKNSLRFEDASSHLKSLNKMANDLRRREKMYKRKLDLKSANLQKAEDEVDLLGDEVDALLRLLNKIYIGLDHYSPVLKHYPGIVDILELVRRELSG
ncbi:hypothetical protein OROHE_010206 [Orobanche hederae]